MHFFVLGATGPTGITLVQHILQRHSPCTVSLYVRSPEKVPGDLSSHPSIKIIKGQLDDFQSMCHAMEGVDIVLSTLGPSVKKGPFHPSDTPIARGYATILKAMHEKEVIRLILLGTASITDPLDKFNVTFSLLVKGVATFARSAYKDVVAIGKTVRSHENLQWTIARVPIITDKDTSTFYAGYVGDGKTNTFISRAAFASFVVDEIEKMNWIQKAPIVCNAL